MQRYNIIIIFHKRNVVLYVNLLGKKNLIVKSNIVLSNIISSIITLIFN